MSPKLHKVLAGIGAVLFAVASGLLKTHVLGPAWDGALQTTVVALGALGITAMPALVDLSKKDGAQ